MLPGGQKMNTVLQLSHETVSEIRPRQRGGCLSLTHPIRGETETPFVSLVAGSNYLGIVSSGAGRPLRDPRIARVSTILQLLSLPQSLLPQLRLLRWRSR